MDKEYQAMREAVAKEWGFSLYRHYTQEQVAALLKCDLSTIKRNRKAGKHRYVSLGGKVRYLGIMIADMILGGPETWGASNTN